MALDHVDPALDCYPLDVLAAIRHMTSLDKAGLRLQQNANRHMLAAAEMTSLFRDLASAVAERENSRPGCSS